VCLCVCVFLCVCLCACVWKHQSQIVVLFWLYIYKIVGWERAKSSLYYIAIPMMGYTLAIWPALEGIEPRWNLWVHGQIWFGFLPMFAYVAVLGTQIHYYYKVEKFLWMYSVPLFITTVVWIVYYQAILPFYQHSRTSYLTRLLLRVIVHPLMFKGGEGISRAFLKNAAERQSNKQVLYRILYPLQVAEALFGRYMVFTAGRPLEAVGMMVLTSLFEIASRSSQVVRDRLLYRILHTKEETDKYFTKKMGNYYEVHIAANNTDMILEYSGLLVSPLLIWLMQDNKTFFDFGYTALLLDNRDLDLLNLFAIELVAQFVIIAATNFLCAIIEDKVCHMPVVHTWHKRRNWWDLIFQLYVWLFAILGLLLTLRILPTFSSCTEFANICTCGFELHRVRCQTLGLNFETGEQL
jgi:hypothetical protein